MQLLRTLIATLMALAALAALAQDREALVLVGHASVPRLDQATAQRLYMGRTVEVGGVAVTVVNTAPGTRLRDRFMSTIMATEDDKYVAYWTVRRHVGKGTPPRELKGTTEVLDFVQSTAGGVGYVLQADVKPGMNVVWKP